MNRPNITEGPWTFDEAMKKQDCGFRIHTPESAAYGMAHIYSPGANAEANAKAIAAVPDLLESLEEMLSEASLAGIDTMPGDDFAGFKIACENARMALHKAGYTF